MALHTTMLMLLALQTDTSPLQIMLNGLSTTQLTSLQSKSSRRMVLRKSVREGCNVGVTVTQVVTATSFTIRRVL
jgi:hypothetical protein